MKEKIEPLTLEKMWDLRKAAPQGSKDPRNWGPFT